MWGLEYNILPMECTYLKRLVIYHYHGLVRDSRSETGIPLTAERVQDRQIVILLACLTLPDSAGSLAVYRGVT